MERARRPWTAEFTKATKRDVKAANEGLCYACGLPADSPIHQGCIEVHHSKPVSQNGTRDPENALPVGKGECHRLLDQLALNDRLYFHMEPDQEYDLSTTSQRNTLRSDELLTQADFVYVDTE